MTRRKLTRVLNGETVWPPPVWLMRQAGRYLPEYRAIRAKAKGFLDLCYTPDYAVEVTLQPIRRYNFDAAILFADILLIPDALGQQVAFKEGEGPVLTPVRNDADLDRLGQRDIHAHLAPVYETVRRLRAELPAETALIGFAGAPWTVATYMVEGRGGTDHEIVKSWAYKDPEGFGRLIDIVTEATIAYLSRQIEAGAEVVQLFDSWAGGLPDFAFQAWCVAPVTRIVAALKARHPEIPVIGFPRAAGGGYQGYAAATGVAGISLDTGVPLDWAARVLAPEAALQGNLDPRLLVAGGDAMLAQIDRCLATLGQGRYIFNLGHGIVPETPPDHVGALVERIRRA